MLFFMGPDPGASGGDNVSSQSTSKAVALDGCRVGGWSGELKPIPYLCHLCVALRPLGSSLVLPERAAISFPGACQRCE